jgi:hypothetical protein
MGLEFLVSLPWWRLVGGLMKKALILLVILAAALVLAQQQTLSIVVKEATVSTGLVFVTADMGGKSIELQCTQSMPGCVSLKNGKYVMVQLPKNHGMYDCQNVDVFPDGSNPASAQRLGTYCMTQK